MIVTAIFPTMVKTGDYFALAAESLSRNSTNDYIILPALNGVGTIYPPGQCAAVNRMIPEVHTEWMAIFNDDFYFPPGWDFQMTFTHDVECPNWIEPNSIGSAPPFRKLEVSSDINTFDHKIVDEFAANNDDYVIENGFNLGCFIKTDLFKKIEGYDEAYDPYGSNSDSDLQYKLESCGVQPKRNRGCLIYHFGSKSESFTPDKQNYWQHNWDYFVDKWGFDREDSPDIWNHNLHIPLDKLKYRPKWSIYR